MFPYMKIDYEEILDLSYNSNYECNCSQFNKNNILEICTKKPLNLKELNFNKNPIFANKDPNFNLAGPVCFNYFLSHEFHKLSKKLKTPNSENFSLLHSNICSLQGNFDKLESLIDHLDYKFDVVAISETWETEGNASFTAGNVPGYQKVEGTKCSSKKGGCGFYIKNSIPYIQRKEFNTTHKSKFSEFETNWIEVINSKNQNIIIGVV